MKPEHCGHRLFEKSSDSSLTTEISYVEMRRPSRISTHAHLRRPQPVVFSKRWSAGSDGRYLKLVPGPDQQSAFAEYMARNRESMIGGNGAASKHITVKTTVTVTREDRKPDRRMSWMNARRRSSLTLSLMPTLELASTRSEKEIQGP